MLFNAKTASLYAKEVVLKPLSVELEPSLMLIAEEQARASHESWMKEKLAQGYVYGPTTNDDPQKGTLTNPLLVPYNDLDSSVQNSNIANAVAVIRIFRDNGCSFVNFTRMILYPLAKQIHDEWAREKINDGWTWGPETDKQNKIHRDLIPFEVLATMPDLKGDISYDVDTARQIIINMISDNDVFPVIESLSICSINAACCPA